MKLSLIDQRAPEFSWTLDLVPHLVFPSNIEVMEITSQYFFQIAAEVSAPLAKTDEIVLIGGSDRTTQEVNKLVGTLPPAIQALTGVDLTGVSHSYLG